MGVMEQDAERINEAMLLYQQALRQDTELLAAEEQPRIHHADPLWISKPASALTQERAVEC